MDAIWFAAVKSMPAVTAAWPSRLNQPANKTQSHLQTASEEALGVQLCILHALCRDAHQSSMLQRATTLAWTAGRSCNGHTN